MAEHYSHYTMIVRGPTLDIDQTTYAAEPGTRRMFDLHVGSCHLLGLYPEHLIAIAKACNDALMTRAEAGS